MDENTFRQHWERVYTEKLPQDVSWFQEKPIISLSLIQNVAGIDSRIIDVGGGASFLTERLLSLGYSSLAVLDISKTALEHAQKRLLNHAHKIKWYEQDITQFVPTEKYDVWHDRAVFHFLTEKRNRELYITALKNSLKSGGHLIISTFAKDGPKKCSGLDTIQYDISSMKRELGDEFVLLKSLSESHYTPSKKEQDFIYFTFHRR